MKHILLALAPLLFLSGTQDRIPEVDVVFSPSGKARAMEKRLTREIRGARREILVAVYQLTSKTLAGELAAAKRRGVDVRVLVDVEQAANGLMSEACRILADARVGLRRVSPDSSSRSGAWRAKFHHKFCVIDGQTAVTGSFNWTVLADEENHENLVVISHRVTASQFADRFLEIWNDEKRSKE